MVCTGQVDLRKIIVCVELIQRVKLTQQLGFSHRQGGARFFDAGVKILMLGRQI